MKKQKYLKEKWTPPAIQDGKPTKYGWIVSHPAMFVLGKRTDIGAFTYIQAAMGAEIREKVQINSHCAVFHDSTTTKSEL